MKTNLIVNAVAIVLLGMLGGCSLFFPYESDFSCNKKDNYGKCMSMQDSYDEAVTGVETQPHMKPASEQDDDEKDMKKAEMKPAAPSAGYGDYVDNMYLSMSRQLRQPISPRVTQPKVIRALVLAYPKDGDNAVLLDARYVHLIVDQPRFVMGQYRDNKKIPVEGVFGE